MNRRSFLTSTTLAAAAAIAGCTSDGDADNPVVGDGTAPTTAAPTTTTGGGSDPLAPEPIEPTVEQFFAAMNKALDDGADVPIEDMPNVVVLLDGLESAGYRVDRSDIAVVTHPDGRSFRLVP